MSVVSLPEVLAERLDPQAPAPRNGRSVICWLRVAVRAHENPALDVALTAAAQLGVPCFVYWALSERYPYASDRLHTFALQGARDLQRDLRGRFVGAVFHFATPGDRQPHLLHLATHAAVVVADVMPVAPFSSWDRAVAKVAPLWRVDASLIAPLWLLPKPHTRAFTFHQAAAPLWRDRVTSDWHDVAPMGQPFVPDELAFSPINLEHADIPTLVAGCEIDHGIGPVHHTVGGTTAANARWRHFRARGLSDYARRRNDPLVDGVSRMSAYLHFGHVSPFQIAREAAAFGGDRADKFLDQLPTFGIKVVVGTTDDAERLQTVIEDLDFPDDALVARGLERDDDHRRLRFIEVKNYLEQESRKRSGWSAMKSVVHWSGRTFEIQVQPLTNLLHERARLTRESHASFKSTRERVRDEVAARMPLFGFYRSLLRWLFVDPSSAPPLHDVVEVVLTE